MFICEIKQIYIKPSKIVNDMIVALSKLEVFCFFVCVTIKQFNYHGRNFIKAHGITHMINHAANSSLKWKENMVITKHVPRDFLYVYIK